MGELLDIRNSEQLENVLINIRRFSYVSVGFRAAMRELPMYWRWSIDSDFAKRHGVSVWMFLRMNLISEAIYRCRETSISDALYNAAEMANIYSEDSYGIIAGYANEHRPKERNLNEVVIGPAYIARATSQASFEIEGYSRISFIPSNIHNAARFSQIERDLNCVIEGKSLEHDKLWASGKGWMDPSWEAVKESLYNDSIDWSFWINWYEATANGEPLNYQMLERIALIPSEDWEQGPAHVNAIIAEIEEEFFLASTAVAEKIELNPATQRLRVVPERMSQRALYSNLLETIQDGMADLRDSPQFDNALSALAPVFERVLDRTFNKYLSSPQRVHDDFVKAKRRIQKLLNVGELAPNDEVIEFVEDLDAGAAHIRANMPQVRESMAALAALRIAEASDADIEGIRAGAEAIAVQSEPDMAEDMRDDAAALVASRDVPKGAPKLLAPDVAYRLGHRIVESKQVLTKANLIKVANGVRAGFGDAQIVMAIPYAVEILLRLLRV